MQVLSVEVPDGASKNATGVISLLHLRPFKGPQQQFPGSARSGAAGRDRLNMDQSAVGTRRCFFIVISPICHTFIFDSGTICAVLKIVNPLLGGDGKKFVKADRRVWNDQRCMRPPTYHRCRYKASAIPT